MASIKLLVILLIFNFHKYVQSNLDTQEPVLYYYGLEESERGLRQCEAREACSAIVRRPWQAPALLRLCRCGRRRRCDAPLPDTHRVEINNVDYFQFCNSSTDWPICSNGDTALVAQTSYEDMNPNKLEELHLQNIQLVPPKIILNCKCRVPNYWKLMDKFKEEPISNYQCHRLSVSKTNEFCGNVSGNLNALYQSGLCMKNHICVHNGGIPYIPISELLYHGMGWRAYCRRIKEDLSSEDYYS